tara:strand:- start:773 stop:2404 length:1632 start_codon:yes stop_codon:yes gene_type:complete
MQLSQLLNMTVPTSPIQGKSAPGDSENKEGDNNLFDSLLEMYISPDKLIKSDEQQNELLSELSDEKNTNLIKAISNLNSEDFINEIKNTLKIADEKTIFFFDNKNGNIFKELVPNFKINQKQIDKLIDFISSFKFTDKSAIISDLVTPLSKEKISEFLRNNNFIFKKDNDDILTFKKIKDGQFLIEKNTIKHESLDNNEKKLIDKIINNNDKDIASNKERNIKLGSFNKNNDQDFINNLKDSKRNEKFNNKDLLSKNIYQLNEIKSRKNDKKVLSQDKIESSEDIIFLKNKFNTKKPNLNSLNKYLNLSEQDSLKETKNIDDINRLNLIQKSQMRDVPGNTKLIQSTKNEKSEELMNIESSENSDSFSPKVGINSNKSSNIFKEISVGKSLPLEITSGNESLEALVNRVGDYIKGHYNKTDESLSLTIKHDLLGKFKLDVTANSDKSIDIKILTGTDDGRLFFARNESEISNNLKNLGLKVSDMKIVAGSDSVNESNNSFDSEKNQNFENGKGHKYSDQDERRKDDSQRRKELWELYKERMDS